MVLWIIYSVYLWHNGLYCYEVNRKTWETWMQNLVTNLCSVWGLVLPVIKTKQYLLSDKPAMLNIFKSPCQNSPAITPLINPFLLNLCSQLISKIQEWSFLMHFVGLTSSKLISCTLSKTDLYVNENNRYTGVYWIKQHSNVKACIFQNTTCCCPVLLYRFYRSNVYNKWL